jgi:hypothetical protein
MACQPPLFAFCNKTTSKVHAKIYFKITQHDLRSPHDGFSCTSAAVAVGAQHSMINVLAQLGMFQQEVTPIVEEIRDDHDDGRGVGISSQLPSSSSRKGVRHAGGPSSERLASNVPDMDVSHAGTPSSSPLASSVPAAPQHGALPSQTPPAVSIRTFLTADAERSGVNALTKSLESLCDRLNESEAEAARLREQHTRDQAECRRLRGQVNEAYQEKAQKMLDVALAASTQAISMIQEEEDAKPKLADVIDLDELRRRRQTAAAQLKAIDARIEELVEGARKRAIKDSSQGASHGANGPNAGQGSESSVTWPW